MLKDHKLFDFHAILVPVLVEQETRGSFYSHCLRIFGVRVIVWGGIR